MANYHFLGAVKLGTNFLPIISAQMDDGLTLFTQDSGATPRSWSYIAPNSSKPRISLQSYALETMMTRFSTLWGKLSSVALTIYRFKSKDGDFYDTGGSATEIVTVPVGNGAWVWRSIRCQQGQPAVCQLDIYGLYQSSAYPFTRTTGGIPAPASIADVLDETFTVGKFWDGTSFQDIRGQTIDFGVSVDHLDCNGNLCADTLAISGVRPTMSVDLTDNSFVRTFLMDSGANPLPAIGVSNEMKLYFRKTDPDVGRVPDATAEHIKISFPAGGFIQKQSEPDSWGQISPTGINVMAKSDGVLRDGVWTPVTASKLSAIS